MTQTELNEIKARCEAATPGPWEHKTHFTTWGNIHEVLVGEGNISSNSDCEFTAHARIDIPALVAEVERLTARAEKAKASYQQVTEYLSANGYIDFDAFVGAYNQVAAERDAAVDDMKVMALAMRESEELSEGCCFACICDAQNLPDNCILPYGECPGYEKAKCFEWRGIQPQKGTE